LIKLENIGLVNLVLDDKVVPELIQDRATPEAIAREIGKYQSDRSYRDRIYNQLLQIPSKLGGVGASARAADEIGQYL
jgi:lipid-A-disaccharide synthase